MRTHYARFGRHAFGVAAAAVVLSAGLAGCGGSDTPKNTGGDTKPAAAPTSSAKTVDKPFTYKSVPTRVAVPRLKINAPVEEVGLAKDGSVQTPTLDEPQLTGWYNRGPTPGQLGPAVILGHIDTAKTGPAVFFKLKDLKPGDKVTVTRKDGSQADFKVQKLKDVSKEQFPSQEVYGDLTYAGLRLITCGGAFDKSKGSYEDNTIVFAKLTGTRAAT